MDQSTIYTCEDAEVTVTFDRGDPELPIRVEADGWLTRSEALTLAGAILAALDAKLEPPVSDASVNEAILRVAKHFDRCVEFGYSKGNGAVIESRHLIPGEIQEVKGHRLVVGFDPDRSDVRAYRLDRIKGEIALA